MSDSWQSSFYDHPIPDVIRPFTLACPASTDLWRSPPSSNRANTPFIYRTVRVSDFKSAKVTVNGPWTKLYDQGGLCMIITSPGEEQTKWIKTGVEMMDGKPRVSCVVTHTWADWGLHPIVADDMSSATVEFVVKDGKLWVYLYGDEGERYPLREITWWAALPGDAECKIGVSAARPGNEGGVLNVEYKDLVVKA